MKGQPIHEGKWSEEEEKQLSSRVRFIPTDNWGNDIKYGETSIKPADNGVFFFSGRIAWQYFMTEV